MALILKIEETSITADCGTLTITDNTGNYNVSTNPGGYGSPNEVRSNLYLLMQLNLRRSTGRESIAVPSYNKHTAALWTVAITEDAEYEIYTFATLAYNSGTNFNLGEITYDISTDAFYKSKQASNVGHAVTDTAWWIPTVDTEDFIAAINAAQANTYSSTYNYMTLCRSLKCEAKAIVAAGCCSCEDTCQLKDYEKIRMKIEGATWLHGMGNYAGAQKIIESLSTLCEGVSGGCGCGH